MESESLEALRKEAFALFENGMLTEAIQKQVKVVNVAGSEKPIRDLKTLALFVFSYKDYRGCLSILAEVEKIDPDHNDFEIFSNLGACNLFLGRYAEAEGTYTKALALRPNSVQIHAALADLYSKTGDLEKSRQHGSTCLNIKAREAGISGRDLSTIPIPPFDPDVPERNVIAFSLWGTENRYLRGAKENVLAAKYLYPGWSCRFYVDRTVPEETLGDLVSEGAHIIVMETASKLFGGLFWRFLVADDPSIDRYLVRDADSIPTIKERVAVGEWLESDKHFHMIRDFPTHTELILAGLWGGVRGALPAIAPQIDKFLDDTLPRRTNDQTFLCQTVWPVFRKSCLVHDNIYQFDGAGVSPSSSNLPSMYHVGQTADIPPTIISAAFIALLPPSLRNVSLTHACDTLQYADLKSTNSKPPIFLFLFFSRTACRVRWCS